MALQKKIKTLYLEIQKALDWNEAVYDFYPALTYRLEDDIRIIGARMTVTAGLDATGLGAIQPGGIHTHGELSLVGDRGKNGTILDLNLQAYYHITTTGAGFLNAHMVDGVVFPDGHGIDLDEGDYLYIHAGCFSGMSTGGKHEHSIFCVVYYVER